MKFGQVDNLSEIDFTFPQLESKYTFRSDRDSKKDVQFYFGAPIWGDKNFKGTLYPPKTPQKNFLQEYVKQFNSIEVNATRFGTPKLTTIQKWRDTAQDIRGADFKFSIKIPQVITHRKDMNCDAARYKFDDFCVALDLMGDNNGVSYAVMPNYLKSNRFKDLQTFIERLPTDVQFAIELRDEGWFKEASVVDDWYHLFLENNIIAINTDTPGRRDVLHLHTTSSNLFVRYVGDFSHPSDKDRIAQWVKQIEEYIAGKVIDTVWFYVHQPGENRQWMVDFFNYLYQKLNLELNFELPLLKSY